MRILVNDLAASFGGAMSILKQFYQYVREYDKENEWIFLLNDSYLEETSRIHVVTYPSVKKSGFHKLYFDFIYGKRVVQALNPDVVLSLQNIITFGVKVPQYVYIHQSIPFQCEKKFSFLRSEERTAAIYQHLIGRIIKLSAKKANGIIVQTQWMKHAVLGSIKNMNKACVVALPDIPHFEAKTESDVHYNQFFYPTNGEIYKNDRLIEQTSTLLNKRGIHDFVVNFTLPAEQKPSSENIKHIGRLTTEQMQAMYAQSVLVFPSYIETVGLPLLEAMRVGTIILAADCAYAHEVLNGYDNAFFFSPWNADELTDLMDSCIAKRITLRSQKDSFDDKMNKESDWKNVIDFLREYNKA